MKCLIAKDTEHCIHNATFNVDLKVPLDLGVRLGPEESERITNKLNN
jgi:hypothetical protein